jgi:hypothetical protein
MQLQRRFFPIACLVLLPAVLLPLRAENEPAALQVKPATQPLSWLSERGIMTTNDAIEAVGVKVTAEQRAEIEKAVAQRNAELQEVNARFSASLSKTLAQSDEELAKKVAEEKDRRRMQLIKSRQPGRYQGMKK